MRSRPEGARARFWQKLASIDFENDCVATFMPDRGLWFHVPDRFIDLLREGQPIPVYVRAVLLHAHIYAHFHDDPLVKEFYDKVWERITLDALTDGQEPRT